jgi:ankyrin repeat protein
MAMPGMGAMFAKPKAGEDLHQKESSEIYHGAEHNDLALIQQGLAGGGDVNVSNLQGVTPLILAVKNWPQNIQMITTLIKAGANVNVVSSDTSPIHEAVRKNSQQVLTILLDHGAQINLHLADGKTPLHLAVQQSLMDMITYLLSKGADPKQKTQQNVSCLHFAASEGDKATIEKFIGYGNNVNEQNSNGKSPLHVAAEKNHLDAIKVLLNAGANKNLKDSWGRLAEECGKVTAYKMLSAHKPGQKYEFVVIGDDEVGKLLPQREDIS